MQAAAGTNALAPADIFMEEPEREGCDLEVELGVNLVDAFTKKHARWSVQPTKTPTPTAWSRVVAPLAPDTELCGLLPAGSTRDGERFSSDLDEVAQEVLTKALLEDQDVALMEVDGASTSDLASEAPSTRSKLEMVVFLYAFEKFRFVYA
jgi:hypothetical protein